MITVKQLKKRLSFYTDDTIVKVVSLKKNNEEYNIFYEDIRHTDDQLNIYIQKDGE